MSEHSARLDWPIQKQLLAADDFLKGRYLRRYRMLFDGGTVIEGSTAPTVVPPPLGDDTVVDPEEMYVASLAACHMLWFVDIARRAELDIARYQDHAVGKMEKDKDGKLWIAKVTLRPMVSLAGDQPADQVQLAALHQKAHARCFIANSVRTVIEVIPEG